MPVGTRRASCSTRCARSARAVIRRRVKVRVLNGEKLEGLTLWGAFAVEDADLDPAPDHRTAQGPERGEQVARRMPPRARGQLAACPGVVTRRSGRATRPTTCSMTSSSEYAVVSMWTAPSACTSGETVRPESIRSRASSDSRVAATSEPPSSAARRVARADGVGGEVDLHRCSGPHDRPDVAALDHDPRAGQRRLDDRALELEQPGPDLGHRADRRHRGVHVRLADRDRDVLAVHADGRCERVRAALDQGFARSGAATAPESCTSTSWRSIHHVIARYMAPVSR